MEKAQTCRKSVVKKRGSKRAPRLSREEIAETMKAVVAARNRIHVIAYKGRWGVLRAGAKRMSKVHLDKQRAINHAKRLARRKKATKILNHDKDGKPQEYIQS